MESVSHTYSLQDIVAAFSETLDLIDPALSGHHRRTAYIASRIARSCGFPESDISDLIVAGGLHDIGALSLREKFNAANFESTTQEAELQNHAEAGYRLLKTFSPFGRIAEIIRHHHILWKNGKNACSSPLAPLCFVLNLADRIDVSIHKQEPILSQAERITRLMRKNSGEIFIPEYVDGFCELALNESFWFDVIHLSNEDLFKRRLLFKPVELPVSDMLKLAEIAARIIDYRSRFTATHSSGVAKVSRFLSEELVFSPGDAVLLEIAGYYHDIGKLAVPEAILEKNAPLSTDETHVMKIHPYRGREILAKIQGFEKIAEWGPLHHEKIDGSGYPYHLAGGELSLGSRIMAVADIFTAIAEDRPYRKAMERKDIAAVLESQARDNKIDPDIVLLLLRRFNDAEEVRKSVEDAARKDYEQLKSEQPLTFSYS
jgi:HD-GYP domain-containing protein (c-di-GMP phosphodiesterase class II)